MYTRSLDVIYYERSVYSVLDLLGDVGGLLAILLGLGDLLVFFFINFTGETLYKYIQEKLFLQQPWNLQTSAISSVQFINKVVISKLKRETCSNMHQRQLAQMAAKKIDKEIDIITFLRKQIAHHIILKTLFTRHEQFLFKRNKRFVL